MGGRPRFGFSLATGLFLRISNNYCITYCAYPILYYIKRSEANTTTQRDETMTNQENWVANRNRLSRLTEGRYLTEADLIDYSTGDIVRKATADELRASIDAAKVDGGAGVIDVDGRSCYVSE